MVGRAAVAITMSCVADNASMIVADIPGTKRMLPPPIGSDPQEAAPSPSDSHSGSVWPLACADPIGQSRFALGTEKGGQCGASKIGVNHRGP